MHFVASSFRESKTEGKLQTRRHWQGCRQVSHKSQHFWPQSTQGLPDSSQCIIPKHPLFFSPLLPSGSLSALRRVPLSPPQNTRSESMNPDFCSILQWAASLGSHLLSGQDTLNHSRGGDSPSLRRGEPRLPVCFGKVGMIPFQTQEDPGERSLPFSKSFKTTTEKQRRAPVHSFP